MALDVVVRAAVYTAVTFIATALLAVEIPATGGYFNLGEAAIYTIAFIAPPLVAGIAGGLGPAIADIVLGYGVFAPATLVIKFTEGYVVSHLIRRIEKGVPSHLRLTVLAVGLLLGSVAVYNGLNVQGVEEVGITVYWSKASIFGAELSFPTIGLLVPSQVWFAIAAIVLAISFIVAFMARETPYVLAMAVGGFIMVTGYFLYEYFVSNPLLGRDPAGAFFEVPVNIGQFTVGIVLSYPVVRFLAKARGGA